MNHSRSRDKHQDFKEHDKSESKMSSIRSIYTRSSPNTNINKEYWEIRGTYSYVSSESGQGWITIVIVKKTLQRWKGDRVEYIVVNKVSN